MPALISELIVTLDTRARGLKSPGHYGYLGAEFAAWLKTNNDRPHRTLMGRQTYELLNALPEEARDDGWMIEAGALDTLRMMICPLILPKTGVEPIFDDLPDMGFQLSSNTLLDGGVFVLDYQPAGAPPVTG